MGDILNQIDFLRETVTKQNKEISQLRAMTNAQFMPIEIYNDEKRQCIIEQLQRVIVYHPTDRVSIEFI